MGLVNLRFKLNSMLSMPHTRMEYSEVTPDILLGTNQCCQAHYKLMLLDHGVTHDISLEGEHVDAPYGADSYLWLPTEDHQPPTLMSLILGCGYIDQILARSGKVYVHCKNGHGRAPTLVAAWFIRHGQSVDEAVKNVQTKRPEVHFEERQLDALHTFVKSL